MKPLSIHHLIRGGAVGVSMLALSGCVTVGTRPDATAVRIREELKAAQAAAPKPAKALETPTPAPVVETPGEKRFDLAVNNAPAAQVFTAIVSGTPYNMIVPADLAGNITVNLKGVTLKEALDTLREIYGYEYKVMGHRILIQANTLQTRIFKVNYLAEKRTGQTDVRVTSGSITGNSPSAGSTAPTTGAVPAGGSASSASFSSQVSSRTETDFWAELGKALDVIVGKEGGRNVVLNPISGVVLIKAMPGELRQVEGFLKATKAAVEKEVMLEAKILDVQLSDGFQTGINWAAYDQFGNRRGTVGVVQPGGTLQYALNQSPVATGSPLSNGDVSVVPGVLGSSVAAAAAGSGFAGLAFQSASFSALLNFLETQGNVQVLSSPRIATLNNQKAVLKVGTDNFFVTNVSTTTNSSGSGTVTSPSITVQPFFSGIALDVTPQIDEDGAIILHVHPSVSSVTDQAKVIDLGQMGKYTLPLASASINETDAVVRVSNGAIVAIGGLMKQNQSDATTQLPGLGDVPVLGTLFGQRQKRFQKEEIVILIKPTVIEDENSWRQGLNETQERLPGFLPRKVAP